MSEFVSMKLVTIVVERILRSQLLEEIRGLGARGFTVSEVTGEGSRGVRASEWEGANIRIETIVTPDVAVRIVDHVSATYFEFHAVIVFVQDVDVVRGDKYV